MTGADGADRLAATLAPDEAAAAGSPGGLGLDLTLEATKPPALHDRDGWIDFGAAGGSYYYSRTAMTADGTLTLDGRHAAGRRRGLVRPPVGRLHLGRRRRLGLVRGEPRRRHGPDPVARPRRRRQLSAGLRHARRPGRDRPPPRRRRVHGRRHGPLDEPGDRRRLPGRLDDRDPGRGPDDRRCARRSRTRNSTRARRPASSTGRARRSCRRRAAASGSAARRTSS